MEKTETKFKKIKSISAPIYVWTFREIGSYYENLKEFLLLLPLNTKVNI